MTLNGPTVQIVWMKNDESATSAMSTTQIQPSTRCGTVPLGAHS